MGPGKDNGLGTALDQIAQGRRRVGHGIGAVADDKAVVGIVAFAQDLYYAQPVFGADIGAVQAIQLKAIHQAELANIGNKLQQLLRVQLRRQPIRGHFRGDGAAGADHENSFHIHLL